MALRIGLPAKKGLTDANDTRYDFRNLVVCNTDGTPRGGLTSPLMTQLLSGTASMVLNIAPFSGIAVRDNGIVLLSNDAPATITLADAPVSDKRIDGIYAKQDDSSSTVSTPDADDNPLFYVISSAVSANPANPTTPDGYLCLGYVTVTAGQTTTNAMTLLRSRQFTAGPGGVVPFFTLADLQAWTNPQQGQLAQVLNDGSNNGFWYVPYNSTTWTPLENTLPDPGMMQVIPSSISATGGSSSVDAEGNVTFTGVSAIQINGCFTSQFKNYLVVFDKTAASAANGGGVRLRAAGADDSSANYDEQQWWTTGATATAQAITGATQFNAETVGGVEDIAEWKFWSPALARATKIDMLSSVWSSATVAIKALIAGRHALANSYDGFSYIASAETITGMIKIYGMA